VTGNGALALAVARALRTRGCYVVVTEAERVPLLNCLRYSKAVGEFVPFERVEFGRWLRWRGDSSQQPFDLGQHLLRLIQSKKLDTWVVLDSSLDHQSLLEARDLISSETNCAIFYPPKDVSILSTDPNEFAQKANAIPMSIKSPMPVQVHTRGGIHRILGGVLGTQKYLLSKVTVLNGDGVQGHYHPRWRDSGFSEPDSGDMIEDVNDDDLPDIDGPSSYILPLESMDKTYDLLARVNISSKYPWLVSEIFTGKAYYANCLIVDGKLNVFAAFMCPTLISYPLEQKEIDNQTTIPSEVPNLIPVDTSSALHFAMKSFTKSFVDSLPTPISSPLNIKFILEEKLVAFGSEGRLWALSCNFDFPQTLLPYDAAIKQYTEKIASPRETVTDGSSLELNSTSIPGIYSLPDDVLQYLVIPILRLLILNNSLTQILKDFNKFFTHWLYWKEELFDIRDPAPWFWYWVVEQPIYTVLRLLVWVTQGFRL
jgi:hypothetical protein